MKLLYAFAILICFAKADYYWRDFHGGPIPFDAVEGGTDASGNATFIGQKFFPEDNSLNLVTVYQEDRFNPPKKIDNFTKILCSQNKDDLQWIKTNITNLHLMTECNQIIVGYLVEAIIVLGRANYKGRTYIGKVYDFEPQKWHSIMFRDVNNSDIRLPEFEVLTFGCKRDFSRYDTTHYKL